MNTLLAVARRYLFSLTHQKIIILRTRHAEDVEQRNKIFNQSAIINYNDYNITTV